MEVHERRPCPEGHPVSTAAFWVVVLVPVAVVAGVIWFLEANDVLSPGGRPVVYTLAVVFTMLWAAVARQAQVRHNARYQHRS